MRLSDYNYSVTDNSAQKRHRALGKACRKIGYKKVYDALTSRKSRSSGYKARRYRADRNWVKKRAEKSSTSLF